MAAGAAQRFGANKLLASWRGAPLYRHALAALPEDCLTRTVVVSGSPEILRAAAERGFEAVQNDCPEAGPGRTIRMGLSHLPPVDACLFTVCDQPELQPHTFRQLAGTYQGGIRAAAFQGRRGNPVIFPASLFGELLQLPDSKGGSAVLNRHAAALTLSECGCRRELTDVDTPAELQALADLQHLLVTGPGAGRLLAQAAARLPAWAAAALKAGTADPAAAVLGDLDTGLAERLLARPDTLLLWSDDCTAEDVRQRLMQTAESRSRQTDGL